MGVEKPEHVMNEARAISVDPCGHSSLAQILTGETSDEKFDIGGERSQVGYVRVAVYSGKSARQHSASRRGDLAQQDQFVPAPP